MSRRTLAEKLVFFVASLCPLCFWLFSTRPALAWDDGGHMLVAQIAYSQLSADAKRKANALLSYLPDVRRSTSPHQPRPYDFVTAACWMDDIKSAPEYDAYRSWHYINPPENGDLRAAPKPNALTAIEDSRSTLETSQALTKENAEALAILMHVVGDIHQPLHCVESDLGGNNFPILGVPGLEPRLRRDGKSVDRAQPATGENAPVFQRLHAFWDSAYRYDGIAQRNRKDVKLLELLYSAGSSARPDLTRIRNVSATLTAYYLPSDKRVLDRRNPAQWIEAGNRLASTLALQTPRGQRPSDAYFSRAHDVACRQIALAGYRLAHLLNAILKSS